MCAGGLIPKLKDPGLSGKVNSLQHHCQALALFIIEVKDPSNMYPLSNYLQFLEKKLSQVL